MADPRKASLRVEPPSRFMTTDAAVPAPWRPTSVGIDRPPRIRPPRAGGLGLLGSFLVHGVLAGMILIASAIAPPRVPEEVAMVTLAWTASAVESAQEPMAGDNPRDPASDAPAEQVPEPQPVQTAEATPPEPDPPEPDPPTPPAPEVLAQALPPRDPPPDLAQDSPPQPTPEALPTTEPVPEVAQRIEPPPLPPPPPPALPRHRSARPAPAARTQTSAQASDTRGGDPAGAASAQPAAPSQTPASQAPVTISPSWNAAVAAWLHRNKTYPAAARSRGEEGAGHVRFTVARDGRVLAVELTRPTGSQALDEALRGLLTGATVPAFPESMPHDRVTVQVQVRYSLER